MDDYRERTHTRTACCSCSAAIVLTPSFSERIPSTQAVAAVSVVMQGMFSCSAVRRM